MTDMINPDHYKGDRKFEPIEVIEDWGLNYRLGNALKYISRNGRKPGEDAREGLKKAIWYLEREIQSQTSRPSYPAPDYDEVLTAQRNGDFDNVYDFYLTGIPFDAADEIDLWDDALGPQEPMDATGNPVYAGDYKGPLYAPYPQAKETAHLQYVGDAEWDDSCDYATGYQGKRDEQFFEEDEIIRIFERRGLIIGVKKDGSSCELGGNGKCL
jgi:hypothetical protein